MIVLKNLISRLTGRRPDQRLGGLTTKDTANFLQRRFPELIIEGKYTLPVRCSRWILVRRPAIGSMGRRCDDGFGGGVVGEAFGDRQHRGTVIVAVSSLLAWAEHHATAVWSNNQAEQAAREYLPTWLLEANNSDETVTIPDVPMHGVLEPYTEDFIRNKTFSIIQSNAAVLPRAGENTKFTL